MDISAVLEVLQVAGPVTAIALFSIKIMADMYAKTIDAHSRETEAMTAALNANTSVIAANTEAINRLGDRVGEVNGKQ